MNIFLILFSVLLLVGCATEMQTKDENLSSVPQSGIKIYENNRKGINAIISKKALESFNTEYTKAPRNKAFAQSTSGAWNWKSNRTSVEHAKTSALIGCQRNNKRSEDLYPCEVININGAWVE
jgi:hypothetical protein